MALDLAQPRTSGRSPFCTPGSFPARPSTGVSPLTTADERSGAQQRSVTRTTRQIRAPGQVGARMIKMPAEGRAQRAAADAAIAAHALWYAETVRDDVCASSFAARLGGLDGVLIPGKTAPVRVDPVVVQGEDAEPN